MIFSFNENSHWMLKYLLNRVKNINFSFIFGVFLLLMYRKNLPLLAIDFCLPVKSYTLIPNVHLDDTIPANTLLLFPAFTQSSPFWWLNLFTSTCSRCCRFSLSTVFGLLLSKRSYTCFCFFGLVWFLLLVSVNSIKALVHMLSFHAALFHRRNPDDQRKVCHAAESGFPPLLSSPLWFAFYSSFF